MKIDFVEYLKDCIHEWFQTSDIEVQALDHHQEPLLEYLPSRSRVPAIRVKEVGVDSVQIILVCHDKTARVKHTVRATIEFDGNVVPKELQ